MYLLCEAIYTRGVAIFAVSVYKRKRLNKAKNKDLTLYYMKKLTDEEFQQLVMRSRGRGRQSEGYSAIFNLLVGESLLITKAEWKNRTSPLTSAMRLQKRFGVLYDKYTLADGSGWVIKRRK